MDEWWTPEGLASLMVIAKAKVASRKTLAADAQRQKTTDLCSTCKIPCCTATCPKGRVKKVIARLLLAAAIVHLDATADPAVATPDHTIDCERGVIYYTNATAYLRADKPLP